MGFNNTHDYNNPLCIDQLARYKAISASCGENFTVVVTVKEGDSREYDNLKKFNDRLYLNAKDQIQKFKKFEEKYNPLKE